MDWIVAQPDHGRTEHIGTIKGFALFWCHICDRLIAISTQGDAKGLVILRPGEQWATHQGATVDGLTFGRIDVQPMED